MSATATAPEYYPEDSKDLKVEVLHLEQRDGAMYDDNRDAIAAEKAELDQTIWNAVKNNRQAVIWSVIVSMCVVMESYDLQLVGNLMAQPGQHQAEISAQVRFADVTTIFQPSSEPLVNTSIPRGVSKSLHRGRRVLHKPGQLEPFLESFFAVHWSNGLATKRPPCSDSS